MKFEVSQFHFLGLVQLRSLCDHIFESLIMDDGTRPTRSLRLGVWSFIPLACQRCQRLPRGQKFPTSTIMPTRLQIPLLLQRPSLSLSNFQALPHIWHISINPCSQKKIDGKVRLFIYRVCSFTPQYPTICVVKDVGALRPDRPGFSRRTVLDVKKEDFFPIWSSL